MRESIPTGGENSVSELPSKSQKKSLRRGDSALAIKAGFWYVISNFMVKAVAFITTPIFARLMTRSEYGEFSNFASWQATLLVLTGAELHNTVSRAYYDYREDFDGYLSTVTLTGWGITAAVYLLFLLCGDFIFRIVAIPPQYVHLLFVLLFFQSSKHIFLVRERTLYRYKSAAALSFVNLFFPTVISILLVVLLPESNRLASRL